VIVMHSSILRDMDLYPRRRNSLKTQEDENHEAGGGGLY
jgi:hypothetical protein